MDRQIDKIDPYNWDDKVLIKVLKELMSRGLVDPKSGMTIPQVDKKDPDSIKNGIDILLKKAQKSLKKTKK